MPSRFTLFEKKRRWIYLSTLLVLAYLITSTYVLFSLSLPSLKEGIDELRFGQNLLLKDPQQAALHFNRASVHFQYSSENLQKAPLVFKILAPLPPFRWQINLLKSTHALANAGTITSSLTSSFPPLTHENDKSINLVLSRGSASYFTFYNDHSDEINQLYFQVLDADSQLQDVPSWIAFTQRQNLDDLKKRLHEINQALPIVMHLSNSLQGAFGDKDTASHTFLVMFQNNAELRPSGGFPGSYATLTTSSGRIRSFAFGQNIYTLDKSLPLPAEIPPPALQTITTHWDFQDATVGTGFLADSTKSIAHFYEAAMHTKVDGIIYIDTSVLEDLLTVTGPLNLPGKDSVSINASNVRLTLTNEVEKNYFLTKNNQITNQPKQIIADLMPALLSKITTTPGAIGKMSSLMERNILSKSIQFYSSNPELNPLLEALLPSDAPATGNWIKIVNTNIGGEKSSLHVAQDVRIQQEYHASDHRITEDVSITRHHNGTGVWPDADNRNFIDMYLPPSAEILTLPTSTGGESQLSADDQKILPPIASNFYPVVSSLSVWKRVGFWATTNVGKTTTYHFRYSIPYSSENEIYFTYLKQAGSRNEHLSLFSYNNAVTTNLFLTK